MTVDIKVNVIIFFVVVVVVQNRKLMKLIFAHKNMNLVGSDYVGFYVFIHFCHS